MRSNHQLLSIYKNFSDFPLVPNSNSSFRLRTASDSRAKIEWMFITLIYLYSVGTQTSCDLQFYANFVFQWSLHIKWQTQMIFHLSPQTLARVERAADKCVGFKYCVARSFSCQWYELEENPCTPSRQRMMYITKW